MANDILSAYPLGFLLARLDSANPRRANGQRLRKLESGQVIARLRLGLHHEPDWQLLKNSTWPLLVDFSFNTLSLGRLPKRGIVLLKTQSVILATGDHLVDFDIENEGQVFLPLKQPIDDLVKISDRIYLNNGLVVLIVKNITKDYIESEVSRSGKINSYDELIIPQQVPEIKIDPKIIKIILKLKPDYLSFPFNHIKQIIKIKKMTKRSSVKVIIKLANFSQRRKVVELLKFVDGLLIDSQRLSWEIPQTKLEVIIQELIEYAKQKEKIIIVAK